MAGMAQWVKKTFITIVDPEREKRVNNLSEFLKSELQSKGDNFSLENAFQSFEHKKVDESLAKEQVYEQLLNRHWADEQISQQEKKIANWVSTALQLSRSEKEKLDYRHASHYFAHALAQSMDDGNLDAGEEARLNRIAQSVGLGLKEFVRHFFRSDGEAFLRAIFSASVTDGNLSQSQWEHLLLTTRKLGLTKAELLEAIRPQAHVFVEHALTDAKADGTMTKEEESTLHSLLSRFQLPTSFQRYAYTEIQTLRQLTKIGEGDLPLIEWPGDIEIRPGETAHYHGFVRYHQLRYLKSGPRSENHAGHITLTNNRLIFSAPTKSYTIRYNRVISHNGGAAQMEIRLEGKPSTDYYFVPPSDFAYAIFRSAVAVANQTKFSRLEGQPSRHISRGVRQTVWQRDGGKCTTCGATDYLEYDHVIPFSKGGSNSDRNIQLLCRRCNLTKSNNI
jgi:tellurite resistance protein